LMGTPDYISPEQALGEPLDGRTDIYSLAVTLFFLLAGEPPFKSDSSIAMALMHVHEKPPLLGLQRADVTPQIDEVIGTALAKWPEERYQTASAFSDAFSEAVVHANNIDRVAFVNRATPHPRVPSKKAMSKARENGNMAQLEPEVRVKPLSGRPMPRSRATLLLLVLSVLLIAAITVGFVLTAAVNSPSKVPGTPVTSNDVLVSNQSAWITSPTFFFDAAGRYHIVKKSSAQTLATALYENTQLSNFRLQVTMNQVAGPLDGGDFYGVVFRSTQDQSHYYLFEICPFTHQYEFERFDGSWHYLESGFMPSLKSAAGQSYTIDAKIVGNLFTFSVNGAPVNTTAFTDTVPSPFTTGEVGLSVEEPNVEVAFSRMYITRL
jgi:serine/threonine protein kinase